MEVLTIDKINRLKPNYKNKGYDVPKWAVFSEVLLREGWSVSLHRSKSTVSKYLFIKKGKLKFKIRFSNHKANFYKEKHCDCNYYVGVGNKGVITTEELLTRLFLKDKEVNR